ncbi:MULTISPECIES: DnaB-like helicase C-terminal domain-containing protein [unclassified Dehalobacter]|jgi:DNA primase (bacterial type)|uniref:DnaB-like helicase C-terminal domain-containing protein n=1 Tax=unclassified Dehalobacter TaxID=2635733 RepID=UPI00028B30C9|nr:MULTISPECIES: DnaB-like helicase C-terminal domain-containing protein [unclassified Dehalobacter]AFV02834.1 DNA primase/helicase [Dehalobacter sp. DCA]AFV05821.1 DNA primase/helicase [Dehalobacter sp. CF]
MDSTELKESLGQRARDIILSGLNIKPNKTELILCPLHPDKNPSMSWFKDGLMWRCHACGGKIDIYDYLTKFENLSFIEAKERVADMIGFTLEPNRATKKQYILPQIKMRELSKAAIDLMAVRKITKQTLDAWRVKESTWNGVNVYVFQYFQDNTLKHVTYREIKQGGLKGGCEKNTEPILWGMWHVEDGKPLVITEGQPDAMAIWQSGYKNVASVPSGANSLTWIDTCWDWLKGREVILWADNDKAGINMADNISRRLDNVKVVHAEDLKDANEVLYKYGPEKVLEIIESASKQIPNGLLDLSHVEYKIANESGIETGFFEYDSHVEDWKEGELTIVFGRNGEGKTTFISQIIAHCLEKKVKTFLYSGEMSEFKIQDWLYKQIVGNKQAHMQETQAKYRIKREIKPEIVKQIKQWHEGILYLFDRKEEKIAKDLDKFFELMALAAKRYGVKLFIIDNLMSKLEENADSLYSDQANFVQRCKDFAGNGRAHVVLVAHPNKEKCEIKKDEGNLTKTDISGSNNIPNKADNIIAVERVWSPDRECDAIITSLKDRESGERKAFKYNFSPRTLRFYNNCTREEVIYGWENREKYEWGTEVQIPCPWDEVET